MSAYTYESINWLDDDGFGGKFAVIKGLFDRILPKNCCFYKFD